MKKIVVYLLSIILLGLNNLAFASDTSNHNFDLFLPAEDVPFGGGGGGGGNGSNGGSSGISGGAVTAITLGSIGGIALLGGLAWAMKAKGGKTICTKENSITSMCLDDKIVSKFKSQNYPYLTRALETNTINPCPKSRYILVPDSIIKNDSVDSVCFEIPKNMGTDLKIVITQISDPYEKEEFKTELYVNNGASQMKLTPFLENKANGAMQMMGEINIAKTSDVGALVISFENKKDENRVQKYAYLIEFSGI